MSLKIFRQIPEMHWHASTTSPVSVCMLLDMGEYGCGFMLFLAFAATLAVPAMLLYCFGITVPSLENRGREDGIHIFRRRQQQSDKPLNILT